jgi:hypothetical protein
MGTDVGYASFGGLSDLALDGDGNLLAVADDGAFVWINLENDTPSGAGQLAYMLGADGNLLQGKSLGDAEGLAVRNGLAIVSFERTHRISAFDLDLCGAAAVEAPISRCRRICRPPCRRESRCRSPHSHPGRQYSVRVRDSGKRPLTNRRGGKPPGSRLTDEVAPNPAGLRLCWV